MAISWLKPDVERLKQASRQGYGFEFSDPQLETFAQQYAGQDVGGLETRLKQRWDESAWRKAFGGSFGGSTPPPAPAPTKGFLAPVVPKPTITTGEIPPGTRPPAPPSGPYDDQAIRALYELYLGRTPNEQEIAGHRPNPGGIAGLTQTIQSSPEYQARGTQQPIPSGGDPFTRDLTAAYQTWYGRNPDPAEIQIHRGNPGGVADVERMLRDSTGGVPFRRPGGDTGSGGGGTTADPYAYFHSLIAGKPPTPQTLIALEPELAKAGIRVLRNAEGVAGKIQLPNGQIVDVIVAAGLGGRAWQWDAGGGGGGSFGGGGGTGINWNGPDLSSYLTQFTDPLTKQYERMLQQQTGLYQHQQAQAQAEAARLQERRNQTQGAVERLTQFLNQQIGQVGARRDQTSAAVQRLTDLVNQRIAKLQGPAYTGTEQEILRTQALDPIERDRQAARQRALENIGARGFDPSSGIAQDLLNQVDRGFDTSRASAQNELGYRQIAEQRSREQEAQQLLESLTQLPQATAPYDQEQQRLLQYLAQLPDAAARGDLDFINSVYALINQPGQQGLATSALLADLPVQRTQLALQTLGQGGSPMSAFSGAAQLLQNTQANRYLANQNSANYWYQLGQTLLGAAA